MDIVFQGVFYNVDNLDLRQRVTNISFIEPKPALTPGWRATGTY